MSDAAMSSLRIAVGIATADRPLVLASMLRTMNQQIRQPDAVIVCSPSVEHYAIDGGNDRVRWVSGQRGLTRQRNAILEAVENFDLVVFFDDDFIPCPYYLKAIEETFRQYPDVVIATGRVVKDGVLGPGLAFEEGLGFLENDAYVESGAVRDVYNAYGCNMAVRVTTARANRLRFDENLPLYGWLEDVDFSRRAAGYGRIVKIGTARGVHLGVKTGRQAGKRLGYSQIANPIYLVRKGSHSWSRALKLISRNVLSNAVRSVYPETYIDRLGRSLGNWLALVDLCIGRLSPGRILQI
jgi:GT2 family glycosyltransferase